MRAFIRSRNRNFRRYSIHCRARYYFCHYYPLQTNSPGMSNQRNFEISLTHLTCCYRALPPLSQEGTPSLLSSASPQKLHKKKLQDSTFQQTHYFTRLVHKCIPQSKKPKNLKRRSMLKIECFHIFDPFSATSSFTGPLMFHFLGNSLQRFCIATLPQSWIKILFYKLLLFVVMSEWSFTMMIGKLSFFLISSPKISIGFYLSPSEMSVKFFSFLHIRALLSFFDLEGRQSYFLISVEEN